MTGKELAALLQDMTPSQMRSAVRFSMEKDDPVIVRFDDGDDLVWIMFEDNTACVARDRPGRTAGAWSSRTTGDIVKLLARIDGEIRS